MWLLFALLSLCAYTIADLCSKKCVDNGNKYTPIEMLILHGIFLFAVGCLLCVFRLGESGEAPWTLLFHHPLLLINLLSAMLYEILFCVSMRFIGLSVVEAVSGASGVFYFVGLFLTYAVTGKISSVNEMLHPLRFIPVVLVLVFTVLLPNVELIGRKNTLSVATESKTRRRYTVIGLVILLFAMGFDSLDSVISTYVFEENYIGLKDYIITIFVLNAIPSIIFYFALRIKSGKWFIPFSANRKSSVGYALFTTSAILLFMVASSCDATRTGILFISYPIVSILGAKWFLKEKYSIMQKICIWIIALGSIAFCISDYVV